MHGHSVKDVELAAVGIIFQISFAQSRDCAADVKLGHRRVVLKAGVRYFNGRLQGQGKLDGSQPQENIFMGIIENYFVDFVTGKDCRQQMAEKLHPI